MTDPKFNSTGFPEASEHKPLSLILRVYVPPSKPSTVKTCVVYETTVELAPPVVTEAVEAVNPLA